MPTRMRRLAHTSRYGLGVPPCLDVYVWIRTDDRATILKRFVDRYVDCANPGDRHRDAFLRTYVEDEPVPGDAELLADLRRDEHADTAFSLYLRSTAFHEAIVTLTEEGNVVLGVGLDDPINDPDVEEEAAKVLARLIEEFGATAGIGGVELAPPQSAAEWAEDALVTLRIGSL